MSARAIEVAAALEEFALIDECEGGNPVVIAHEREAATIIKAQSEMLDELVDAFKTLCVPDVSYHGGEIRIAFASHGAALMAMRVAREVLAKVEGQS